MWMLYKETDQEIYGQINNYALFPTLCPLKTSMVHHKSDNAIRYRERQKPTTMSKQAVFTRTIHGNMSVPYKTWKILKYYLENV
jgi:hypothetical protein